MPTLSVGEAAHKIGVPPNLLTNMLYRQQLDDKRCPIVSGRRQIPVDYVPEIKRILESAGKLRDFMEESERSTATLQAVHDSSKRFGDLIDSFKQSPVSDLIDSLKNSSLAKCLDGIEQVNKQLDTKVPFPQF